MNDLTLAKLLRAWDLDQSLPKSRHVHDAIRPTMGLLSGLFERLSRETIHYRDIKLVKFAVSDGTRTWEIVVGEGPWSIAGSKGKRGRPKQTSRDKRLKRSYRDAVPKFRKFIQALKKNGLRGRKTTFEQRVAFAKSLATETGAGSTWLEDVDWQQASPVANVGFQIDRHRLDSSVAWVDFVAGRCEAGLLAKDYLAFLFQRAPGTVANLLKPKRARPRAR